MGPILENNRRRWLVQHGAEQATEKPSRGEVMPPIMLEMKSRCARLFGGIQGAADLLKLSG